MRARLTAILRGGGVDQPHDCYISTVGKQAGSPSTAVLTRSIFVDAALIWVTLGNFALLLRAFNWCARAHAADAGIICGARVVVITGGVICMAGRQNQRQYVSTIDPLSHESQN